MPDLTLPPLIRPDLEAVVSRLVGRTTPEGEWGGTPHWLLTRGLNSRGYYQIKMPGPGRVMVLAHRIGQEAFVSPIPDGFDVDHLCRVTNCWSPFHTESVTPLENQRRAALARRQAAGEAKPVHVELIPRQTSQPEQRARRQPEQPAPRRARQVKSRGRATECRRGHELTPDNVYLGRNQKGIETRTCKVCALDRQRARRSAAASEPLAATNAAPPAGVEPATRSLEETCSIR